MLVYVMSLWRNDAERDLEDRVKHLLSKSSRQHELRWLWITGDNSDETTQRLGDAVTERMRASAGPCPVTIVDADTGIVGEDTATRRRRGSAHATEMFSQIPADAGFVLLHESDLQSEVDVIDQLFDAGNGQPIAGWPMININAAAQFYDVWAYRDLHGRQFMPSEPFSQQYVSGRPFRVGSFGSVWLAPADLVRGRVITDRAILELCEQWRAEGVVLWCDPRIPIVQPVNLWSPCL